ncbi:MAG: hypothetical protein ABIV06_04425 [Thermoanaerobaculia bacterium]
MALRCTADGDLDSTFSDDGVLPIADSGVDDPVDSVASDLIQLPSRDFFAAVEVPADFLARPLSPGAL